MTGKFKCTDVSRQAFNDERVTLENPEATIILHNKAVHGAFVQGKEYHVSIGSQQTNGKKKGK